MSNTETEAVNIGDLQVWWIPQIPMECFAVNVASVAEGAKLLRVLGDYDQFQLDHNIKPDYSNAGGIRRWCADNGDGVPGWEDWYDEETGEDDPEEWMAAGHKPAGRLAYGPAGQTSIAYGDIRLAEGWSFEPPA